MELTVTLKHGPLDAEFVGDEREEVEENLLAFMEFLEENEGVFDGIEFETAVSAPEGQASLDTYDQTQSSQDNIEDSFEPSTSDERDSVLNPIARKIDATVSGLEEIVYVDEDKEEKPQLLIDDTDRLGDTVPERQRNAALILLLVWQECYGEDAMMTSALKDIFALKGISTGNTSRAWSGEGESWFDSAGQGPSASVKLRGPGEREAYKLLKDLIGEDLE